MALSMDSSIESSKSSPTKTQFPTKIKKETKPSSHRVFISSIFIFNSVLINFIVFKPDLI